MDKILICGLALFGLHRLLRSKDPQRAFFSFHYAADIWRVNAVRNSWVTYRDPAKAGFFDHSLWETAKTKGDAAIRRLIDEALEDSEVTVVLIGEHTYKSRWVRYEIERSLARNNGLIGVYIDRLRNAQGLQSAVGPSPFDFIAFDEGGPPIASAIPHYEWVSEDGYSNLRKWISEAPRLSEIADELGVDLDEEDDDDEEGDEDEGDEDEGDEEDEDEDDEDEDDEDDEEDDVDDDADDDDDDE